MMIADDLFRRVAECCQEVLIRGENFPLGSELDHRLRTRKRCQLAVILGASALRRRDIGSDLDHLVRFAETKTGL